MQTALGKKAFAEKDWQRMDGAQCVVEKLVEPDGLFEDFVPLPDELQGQGPETSVSIVPLRGRLVILVWVWAALVVD